MCAYTCDLYIYTCVYTYIFLIGNILFALYLNYESFIPPDPAYLQRGIVVTFPFKSFPYKNSADITVH